LAEGHDMAKELATLGSTYHALVKVKPESLDQTRHEVLQHFAKRGMPGVVILFTIPYAEAKAHMEKLGLDIGRIFFIDCVTKGAPDRPTSPSP